MTLLELIAKAATTGQTLTTPPDHPVVLDPDSVFPALNPKGDEPNALTLPIPVIGWQISQTDSELIDLCKNFFIELGERLKYSNSFRKGEFLRMLDKFLENVGKKFGIRTFVASSNFGYTRVIFEKVGFLMGKEVAALVLGACVTFEIWELVETLIVNGFVGNSCYPNLVPRLVAKGRSDLLCHCVKHASDLGSLELCLILKHFLNSQRHASLINVRKEWETQALLAIDKATDKNFSRKNAVVAKEALVLLMVAHDGFSSLELCLHYLLASPNIDEVVLSSAISKLNGKEMMSLIRYLGKWLNKYERFPQAVPYPKASSTLGLKACEWVPKLEDVVKCLSIVLDENFSTLVLHPDFHKEISSIETTVSSLASEARFSCFVGSVAEKLKIEVQGS